MPRLTEEKLHALARAKQPMVVAVGDGSGLCLRITPTFKSWVLRYRIEGKPHWLTLGEFNDDIGLREGKRRATAARATINKGTDPIAEKRRVRQEAEAARSALRTATTFRDLAQD